MVIVMHMMVMTSYFIYDEEDASPRQEEAEVFRKLYRTVIDAFHHFLGSARLAEKAALTVSSLTALPQFHLSQDIVTLLLDAIDTHIKDAEAVTACVNALKRCPMAHLCELKIARTKGKMSAAALNALSPNTAELAGKLGDVMRCVMKAVEHWAGDSEGEATIEACLISLYIQAASARSLRPGPWV